MILSSPPPAGQRMPASGRSWRPFPARCAMTSSKDVGNRPLPTVRGGDRTMARRALALLGEAGYSIKDGVLVERTSSRPFAFEILVRSSIQERLSRIYADSLRRICIYATVRLVDELQY